MLVSRLLSPTPQQTACVVLSDHPSPLSLIPTATVFSLSTFLLDFLLPHYSNGCTKHGRAAHSTRAIGGSMAVYCTDKRHLNNSDVEENGDWIGDISGEIINTVYVLVLEIEFKPLNQRRVNCLYYTR